MLKPRAAGLHTPSSVPQLIRTSMNSVTSMVQPSATQAPWNCTTFDALRQETISVSAKRLRSPVAVQHCSVRHPAGLHHAAAQEIVQQDSQTHAIRREPRHQTRLVRPLPFELERQAAGLTTWRLNLRTSPAAAQDGDLAAELDLRRVVLLPPQHLDRHRLHPAQHRLVHLHVKKAANSPGRPTALVECWFSCFISCTVSDVPDA